MTKDTYYADWQEKELNFDDSGDLIFATTPKPKPAKAPELSTELINAGWTLVKHSDGTWQCRNTDGRYTGTHWKAERAIAEISTNKRIIAIGISEYGEPFTVTAADEDPHGFHAMLDALQDNQVAPLVQSTPEQRDEVEAEKIGEEFSTTAGLP